MDMMKNMNPDDMQRMMPTVQQNPHLYQQAMNMMQGGASPGPNTTPSPPSWGPVPPTSSLQGSEDFPELRPISKLKSEGNDFFNCSKFEEAGSKYLYAVVDIESLRLKLTNSHTSNPAFLKALNDLEISCRNNYCTAKVKLEEFDLLIRHAERVLELDQSNGKAHFNLAQAHAALHDITKASRHLQEASKVINSPQLSALQTKIKSMAAQFSEQKSDSQLFSESIKGEKPKEDSSSHSEFQVIDSENSNKKSTEQNPVQNPTGNSSPTSPAQEKREAEDFPITEEGTFEDLEKYFRHESTSSKQSEPNSVPFVPEPAQAQKSDEKVKKTSNEQMPPTSKETPTSQASFFEKYWQVLLGVLLGLILAKVLKV